MRLVDWGSYDAWNQAVAETIFPESGDATPVYLDLEEDLLAEVAARPAGPVIRERGYARQYAALWSAASCSR